MLLLVILLIAIAYILVGVGSVVIRNYVAHQFFKKYMPDLPVIPNPNIFKGHLHRIIFIKKNCPMITELHKKYGTTFGFYMCNQPWVSTKDLDLIKTVFVEQAHKHYNKSELGFPIKEFNRSILQSSNEIWKRGRRAVAPALTNSKIRSDEISGDIESVITKLEISLQKRISDAEFKTGSRGIVLDVGDIFQRFSLAVIFLIAYKQDNVVDFDSKTDKWVEWLDEGIRDATNPMVGWCMMFPFVRPFGYFLIRWFPFDQIRAKVVDYLNQVIIMNRYARENYRKTQLDKGPQAKDFSEVMSHGDFKRRMVDTVIDQYHSKKIDRDDLISNMWAMLMAGYMTTADTITCLAWQLARNTDIQEKLRQAILNEGVDAEYLDWCVHEIVRWHPAVPLGPGRFLTESIEVNGKVYAKGAYITPSIYCIHKDSEIWPDADTFKPERWKDRDSFHPAAFMGFSLGTRNCPGAKLAIHEIKLAIKMILTKFRIETCSETAQEYAFSSPILIENNLDEPIKLRIVAI